MSQVRQATTKTDAVVAMSGGVDSSVAAALLKNEGWRVRGVFMALGQPDVEQQIARVERIAHHLDIPLAVLDLAEPFRRQVIDYFCQSYRAGRTPNPCVVCNRTIKCGALLDRIRASDPEALLVTGHYARLRTDEAGICRLARGRDEKKDQSYFLAALSQEQLKSLHFPLGGHLKTEVIRQAGIFGVEGLRSPESQDICFLKGTSVAGFLAGCGENPPPGEIVTRDGQVLGRHGGIHSFTVGQRRGLGIPDATPYYVVAIEAGTNRVVVGKEEDLWQRRLRVRGDQWLAGAPPRLAGEYEVRIRYRHQAAPAEVRREPDGQLLVTFARPQRAITPGQLAVFYQEGEVAGSGEIEASLPD